MTDFFIFFFAVVCGVFCVWSIVRLCSVSLRYTTSNSRVHLHTRDTAVDEQITIFVRNVFFSLICRQLNVFRGARCLSAKLFVYRVFDLFSFSLSAINCEK